MMTELVGGCLCGAVRYRAETPSKVHYYCHCSDCRRYGGSAYHAAILVSAEALKVDGDLQTWTMTANSGRTVARHACAVCFFSPVHVTLARPGTLLGQGGQS